MTDPRSTARPGFRRFFAAAAVALVAAFGALPAAGETPADVIRDLNEARRADGLPALVTDPSVTRAAAGHVADMVKQGYVDVTAPDGTDAGAWLQRAGVRTPEFSAVAVSGLPDPQTLSTALRRSPALAELLKAPGEVRIGIGHHEEMFRLSDGLVTAEAWSVIVARPVPPAVVDAVPDLLLEINRARAGKGAAPVRLNPKLMQAALMQAEDMAERDYIGHARPDGPRLVDRVRIQLQPGRGEHGGRPGLRPRRGGGMALQSRPCPDTLRCRIRRGRARLSPRADFPGHRGRSPCVGRRVRRAVTA